MNMHAREISVELAVRIEPLARTLFPRGCRECGSWRIGSLDGEAGGSLAICLTGAKRGLWIDHATGAKGDALDLVRDALGTDTRGALDWARHWLGEPSLSPPIKRREPSPQDEFAEVRDRAKRRALALDVWRESIDPRGTLAETYLAEERGLIDVIDDTLALTIRVHPSCLFRDGEERVRAPALICALRDPAAAMHACSNFRDEMDAIERAFLTDPANVLAIQRIRLDADGKKIGRRTLGPMDNGAVFCGSIWDWFYSGQATIGEGVETMLAMRKFGFQGCLAVCGASRFKSFNPPWSFAEIIISGEHDEGPSESAWRAAGPRWAAAGHHVRVWVPPAADGAGAPITDAKGRCPPKDANDLLLALRARKATS